VEHLVDHLKSLDMSPSQVIVIGDTPDDAWAASEVGAAVVLYDGGSHHLPTLKSAGAPVAHSLREAVELARRIAHGAPVETPA
jgi:phosphoglycolate phosphatase-like HAD superfamily hydrolase